MTYWLLAKYMGMECKWLLFLPVYRYAYIGLVANVYSIENRVMGVDYSVYEVVTSTMFYVFLGAYFLYHNHLILYGLGAVTVFWIFLRFVELYSILCGFRKKAFLWSVISLVPGVLLYQAYYLWRNVNVKSTS